MKICRRKGSECYTKNFSLPGKILQNQLHVLLAGGASIAKFRRIMCCIKESMKRYGYESAWFTRISSHKLRCVTKEFVDIEYPVPNHEAEHQIKANEDKRRLMVLQVSVGQDLEEFYSRIKRGKITKETNGETKFLKLFCLLNKEDRRKIDRGDEDFVKTFFHSDPDVPHDEWKRNESKHLKFSSHSASRKTAFVDIGDKTLDHHLGKRWDNRPILSSSDHGFPEIKKVIFTNSKPLKPEELYDLLRHSNFEDPSK